MCRRRHSKIPSRTDKKKITSLTMAHNPSFQVYSTIFEVMPMLMGSEMALKAIQMMKNSTLVVTGMFDFAPLPPSFHRSVVPSFRRSVHHPIITTGTVVSIVVSSSSSEEEEATAVILRYHHIK